MQENTKNKTRTAHKPYVAVDIMGIYMTNDDTGPSSSKVQHKRQKPRIYSGTYPAFLWKRAV
jgi:hypothetical protein